MTEGSVRPTGYPIDAVKTVIGNAARIDALERVSREELELIGSELGLSNEAMSQAIAALDQNAVVHSSSPIWRRPGFQALCLAAGISSAGGCMLITYLADRISQPPLVFVGFTIFASLSALEVGAAFRLKGPGRFAAYHALNAAIWGSWGTAWYMLAPQDYRGIGTAWFVMGAAAGAIIQALRNGGPGSFRSKVLKQIPTISAIANRLRTWVHLERRSLRSASVTA